MRNTFFGIALGVLTLACTPSAWEHSVVTVPTRQMPDPASGTTVVITRVTDKRSFVQVPQKFYGIPSQKGGASADPALRPRTVGRKGSSASDVIGDVLLPENETVANLVRKELTAVLRSSGYRVADSATQAPPGAFTMEVDINRFWTWLEYGVTHNTIDYNASLSIASPALKGDGHVLLELEDGHWHSSLINDQDWVKIAQDCTTAVGDKFKAALKPAN